MSASQIDIKINVTGQEKLQLYSQVSVGLQLHKAKLQQINKQLCNICSSSSAPFLLVEFPVVDFKEEIDEKKINSEAKDSMYEYREIVKDNKFYLSGNWKKQENIKFCKNLQKSLGKLTELDSFVKLNVGIYDVQKIKTREQLWNKATIKSSAKIDSKFTEILHELLKKVSPQFCDSPIAIFLELLESIDLNLNLKKLEPFEVWLSQLILKFLGSEIFTNQRLLQRLKQTKEEIVIRLTVGELFSIKVKSEARAIATFVSLV